MSFTTAKYTASSLCLLVLLGAGSAQYVSKNSEIEGGPVQTQGTSIPSGTATRAPVTVPDIISVRTYFSNDPAVACLAPPQPVHGEWQLDRFRCDSISDCTIPEGTELEPGSQLIFKCNHGYKLEGSGNVYCRASGKWSAIPSCTAVKCPTLNSVSTLVTCTRFKKWENCDAEVPPNTRAEISCRQGYKKDTNTITAQREIVTCNWHGLWEPEPIKCIPVCGVAITHQTPFIAGGSLARTGDFPWHASLFIEKKTPTGTKKKFICGATIIQTNFLLTAAHCVYDEGTRTRMDAEKFSVITGNVLRDYDYPYHNPTVVRKAEVKNIYISCSYSGLTGNYGSDIALLELKRSFEFSSILLPACLDDSGHSDRLLEPGAFGRVAGFGRTETSEASGILQTITVPYIPYLQCKAPDNAAQNQAFISSDKFCAGYKNGSAVCEGDSGGGLVFKKGDLWYVMGIVSVGLGVDLDNGEKTCDKYSYSLYTKVSTYMSWIKDVLFYAQQDLSLTSCGSISYV